MLSIKSFSLTVLSRPQSTNNKTTDNMTVMICFTIAKLLKGSADAKYLTVIWCYIGLYINIASV